MKARQGAAARRTGAPDAGEGTTAARRAPFRTAGAVVLAAGALAAVLAAPARAQDGPATAVPDLPGVPATVQDLQGLQGPVVTHPSESPRDYPAGEVCAFPTHTEFPVSDLRMRTWTDSAGTPVLAIEDGPLLMEVTNLDTGRSIVRDISGTGVITYPTPDSYVLSGNDWSAAFHTTDRPVHNRWIVASTFMSVKVSTAGGVTSRELLALSGPYEDICATLA
ncbi:hypothetical protein [Streptomyces sp. NPDC020983]|uniref:hypothetical protein n=1 Tax=Streptomyces sp. NPDC020983 TaxID=3365106 RepID=UPI00379BFB40